MADLNVPLSPTTITAGQSGHAGIHSTERDYIESLRVAVNTLNSSGVPAVGRGGKLTVASSALPAAARNACDYQCTGTNDQTVINQALLRASRANDGFGGEGWIGVELVGPTFFIGNNGSTSITMYPNTALWGQGSGTLINPMWPTNVDRGAIELYSVDTAHVRLSSFTIGKHNAVDFNGHGIKFIGGAAASNHEIKSGSDHFIWIDNINIHRSARKGMWITSDTGSNGGARETHITNCLAYNCIQEGFLLDGASDCKIINCTATGGENYPRFSLSGGNAKVDHCKTFFSGNRNGSASDGFLISSSRCDITNCSAQDNGRYGFNFQGAMAFGGNLRADSNSANTATGAGFFIATDGMFTGLMANNRIQNTNFQNRGIEFSGSPLVNVQGWVHIDSGTTQVVGTPATNSYVRVVRAVGTQGNIDTSASIYAVG